jgi:hypothetical protein
MISLLIHEFSRIKHELHEFYYNFVIPNGRQTGGILNGTHI